MKIEEIHKSNKRTFRKMCNILDGMGVLDEYLKELDRYWKRIGGKPEFCNHKVSSMYGMMNYSFGFSSSKRGFSFWASIRDKMIYYG